MTAGGQVLAQGRGDVGFGCERAEGVATDNDIEADVGRCRVLFCRAGGDLLLELEQRSL